MTLLAVLVSIFLGICTLIVMVSTYQARKDLYQEQLESFVQEYKDNLERQFSADLESLSTISYFVGTDKFVQLDEGFLDPIQYKQFLKLVYYKHTGEDKLKEIQQEIDQKLDDPHITEAVLEAVNVSWNGEKYVSEVFWHRILKKKFIFYSVPVKNQKNEIVGALFGLKDIQVFADILNRITRSKIPFDIDWLDKEGNFITWSEHSVSKQKMESIYEGYYLMEKDKELVETNIQKKQSFFTTFYVGNNSYPIYFQPLSYNGWYIACVSTIKNFKSSTYTSLMIIFTVFFISILLYIAFLLFGTKILQNNQKRLMQLAYYDTITGAYNFEHFRGRLYQGKFEAGQYSIAILNIRHFQYINEVFGTERSDLLLKIVINTIRPFLKENEFYCRHQADQFYLLLQEGKKDRLEYRLNQIMEEIGVEAAKEESSYPVTLYCGIAILEHEQDISSDLWLHQAEFALKQGRAEHGNIIKCYDRTMHEMDLLQNSIEGRMYEALKQGEFHLYLQPKIDIQNDQLIGAEALVRWICKDGTMIYPDQFIPIFEKNGFCVELDYFMFEEVCKYLSKWKKQENICFAISVNQSKLMFYQSNYVEKLCQITKKYGIRNEQITLEVLEGLVVKNREQLKLIMKQLRQKGFRISLDDFGTGYSSLSLLADMELDEIKLDRSFLSEQLIHKPSGKKVLENMIKLSNDLNFMTVVEGVETEEHHQLLKQYGCQIGQGYYYSKPMSVIDFERVFEI